MSSEPAFEIPVEQAHKQPHYKYFVDVWFRCPIDDIMQIGHDFPVYIVFTMGQSLHMRQGTRVYRRGN